MSEFTLREGIRKNAFFIGLFVLLLGAAAYRYANPGSAPALPTPNLAPRALPAEQSPTTPITDSAQSPEQDRRHSADRRHHCGTPEETRRESKL